MSYPTRKKVMLTGVLKKGSKNVLVVDKKHYIISDFLAMRIRIKKWLLGTMTLILSFIFFYSIEQYSDLPFAEAEPAVLLDGFSKAFIFIGAVVVGFFIISIIITPKAVRIHIKKEIVNYEDM